MQFGLYAPVPHVTVGSKPIEQSVVGAVLALLNELRALAGAERRLTTPEQIATLHLLGKLPAK